MVIDSLEFARRQGRLAGRLGLDGLPRLAEILFDNAGSLEYEVSGETAGSAAFLILKLDGPLLLTCQRCLGGLEFDLSLSRRMLLLEPGMPWPEDDQAGGLEDEDCDALEASRELDLAPLLEEEILLALPIAPRHERCDPPHSLAGLEKVSPFALLARLKRN